jgi:hypothetical protein
MIKHGTFAFKDTRKRSLTWFGDNVNVVIMNFSLFVEKFIKNKKPEWAFLLFA